MRYNEIGDLISIIQTEYIKVSDNWFENNRGKLINLKNKQVKDIRQDRDIFQYILDYRSYLSEYFNFNEFDFPNVTTRVKAQNSLESKIQRYIIEKTEHGKSPINKCVNDLFGIRIVVDAPIIFEELHAYIQSKFGLKCINASKSEYIATHIYIKKEKDNFAFPWELQIWEEKNKASNLNSHHKYKQDYAKWEKETQGGNKQ